MKKCLLPLAVLALSACRASVPGAVDKTPDVTTPPVVDGGNETPLPFGLGCGWIAVSDADLANVLYPDEAAMYWLAAVPHVPGLRLRVDGYYPKARYFSYNVYDPLLRPVDAISDYQVAAEEGQPNPFATANASAGGSYHAYVEFTQKPDQPAPNTIYSGFVNAGAATLPNPLLTVLAYRIYVPSDGLRGEMPLPTLTLETSSGQKLYTLPNCDGPLLPNLGGGVLPPLGLNPLLAGTDYPEQLSALPYPPAAYPARTAVFYGLPDSYIGIVNNVSPVDVPIKPGSLPLTGGGGFLSNRDNSYTVTAFGRDHGNIFLLRARAPSWRGQAGVGFGSEDTRYWSICQNEFATQRYVACVHDKNVALDAQGFYTVVVSDETDRPANATPDNHFAWLPWGFYPDGLLIYRQLLAAPDFMPAIRNVPAGTDPIEIMGDYLPQSTFCPRAVFAAAGNDPATVFATCAAAAE